MNKFEYFSENLSEGRFGGSKIVNLNVTENSVVLDLLLSFHILQDEKAQVFLVVQACKNI